MINGKFGVAIAGCGGIGPAHAEGVLANKDIAELIAVVDKDEAKAAKMAKENCAKKVYKDVNEMLKDKEIDIVTVAVPSGLHMDIAVSAAKAGKHVLSEKPLDVTLAKCDVMIKAAKEAKVKLGVVYQRRTFAESRIMREVVQSGRLGKLIFGDAYLKYFRGSDYYKSAGWRATWELDGGGALMNQGIHGVDLISWIMGGVNSVYATCETKVHDIIVEDTAVAMIRFKNGAVGVIEGATSVYPGLPTRFEVHGDKGVIALEDKGFTAWDIKDEKEKPELFKKAEQASGHAILVKDLIEAIKTDREPMVNGEEGRKAVEIILAIYESSKSKKEVKVG